MMLKWRWRREKNEKREEEKELKERERGNTLYFVKRGRRKEKENSHN